MSSVSEATPSNLRSALEVERLYSVRRDIGIPIQTCKKCGGNNRTTDYLCICGMYAKWFRYNDQLDARRLRSDGVEVRDGDDYEWEVNDD